MSRLKPWLWLPPKLAHDLGPYALAVLAKVPPTSTPKWKPFTWKGLHFQNRLGIAGGVDKNGVSLRHWWNLGAGFLEAGTTTPKPQAANPGVILRRQVEEKALWNKMGFPNQGVETLKANLQRLPKPYRTPIFVNIGKNRTTPNDLAFQDYAACMSVIDDLADAFVVNISSPNTENLRDLQEEESLKNLLRNVQQANTHKKPILLKISPDCSEATLTGIIQASCENHIDGWIISNTTRKRPNGIHFPEEGGMSGRPLAERSKHTLKQFISLLGDQRQDRLIVSVGGISNQKDVLERLEIGADLVQLYTSLIFEGPFLFRHICQS